MGTAPHRCSSTPGKPVRYGGGSSSRGRSSMAEPQPSKLVMRVRFPSPAPAEFPQLRATFGAAAVQDQEAPERRRARCMPNEALSACCFAAPGSPPEPPRWPRHGRARRAGRSAPRGSLSDPSAPSAREGALLVAIVHHHFSVLVFIANSPGQSWPRMSFEKWTLFWPLLGLRQPEFPPLRTVSGTELTEIFTHPGRWIPPVRGSGMQAAS